MARGLPGACALQTLHSERPLYWHDYADAWLNFPLGKVLDYGCGKGDFLRRIADRADERWGVDFNPDVVAEAGRHAGINALQIAPGQPLHFADGEFDAVISMEVVEHTADKRALLRECARVLAPGGKLLLTTAHKGLLTFLDPGNLKFVAPGLHRFVHCTILRRLNNRLSRTRSPAGDQLIVLFRKKG